MRIIASDELLHGVEHVSLRDFGNVWERRSPQRHRENVS